MHQPRPFFGRAGDWLTAEHDGIEPWEPVVEARPGELLDLRWDEGQPLRISFDAHPSGTVVTIRVTEFSGDTLEYGIEGVLLYDKFPRHLRRPLTSST